MDGTAKSLESQDELLPETKQQVEEINYPMPGETTGEGNTHSMPDVEFIDEDGQKIA